MTPRCVERERQITTESVRVLRGRERASVLRRREGGRRRRRRGGLGGW